MENRMDVLNSVFRSNVSTLWDLACDKVNYNTRLARVAEVRAERQGTQETWNTLDTVNVELTRWRKVENNMFDVADQYDKLVIQAWL